jgi:hypothetical protein
LSEALQSVNPYPQDRTFVLKLHHDTDLSRGVLRGRIEHVASGIRGEFSGTEQLLGWLASGLEYRCDETPAPRPT